MRETSKQQAQWIWYPGDFEFMLNLRVHSSRYERGMQIAPMWRLDSFYPCIKFRKTFTIKNETVIYIETDGTAAVELDNSGNYSYDYKNGIHMKEGKHFLMITVLNTSGLPSVFIDNDQIRTDKTWEVSCSDGEWVNADCWNFSDPNNPPSAFKLKTKAVEAVLAENISNGQLYDFGIELMGYLKLQNIRGAGKVTVSYGESREEALDFENSYIIEDMEVNGDVETAHSLAFRYICVKCSEGLTIDNITAIYEFLPIENRGGFECDEVLLNDIYKISLHTLHLNSREFFLDGIKRDRWVWGGDSYQSYLLNYYSFFDKEICKRTINVLRGKDPVKQHQNTIQDYTCYWFISLLDYYIYTGDKDFITQKYQSAKTLMNFCLERTDERGFMLSQSGDWVFVDWAPIDNTGDISVIQILFARSLEAMGILAKVSGNFDDGKMYRQLFERILKNIFNVFWSSQYGCFTHGPALSSGAVVTKYANIFALLFGYLNKDERQQVIKNAILNDSVLKITTPYMKFYEVAALCEARCFESVKHFVEEYWGGMLSLGATSFWETYDQTERGMEHYAMYGKPFGKSLCHAWGAGPILIFGKYFLGVKPIEAGYSTFEVSPVLAGMKYIKGKVPTPNGEIEVYLDKSRLEIWNNTPGNGKIMLDEISEIIGPYERKIIQNSRFKA